ncbi:MAG: 1-(5-phosphoribosyl)-5-[(5-phosphoribosylamino)methylideneamino]imidazole-4-carboxamide isomerase [Dehalococcoidales bacterium]|nr:1-(5-phosphoribosyl)-5-[(5-phosphoribosylamino)methylideneamino]imidazole-4-carboxamide isomerase [Dehalococcoidales bacterium]
MPAVDLKGGKCVRLYQGDYNQVTQFSDDPLDVALKWQAMGASRLHIVDLDGAATGEPVNLEVIRNIASAALIPTQLGGGLRDIETIQQMLRLGIERVILGTVAVENPKLVEEACKRFNDYIIVSIDARDGFVSTHGWLKETSLTTVQFAENMIKLGARRFIHTDIVRDGTLTEPNFTAIAELVHSIKTPVIAAGGITSILHLKMLKQLGVEGAIVGKALYTGDINLKEALSEINR